MNRQEFQAFIWENATPLYRDMPWRDNTSPYYVLVSEVMLQQTQVERVVVKFKQFIDLFPDVQTLANAPLSQVLTVWSGLGYNRRAKYLHLSAQIITQQYEGVFPDTLSRLVTLPGVGKNTAGALLAYSFNKPVVFVETNIRTVYYNHFFNDEQQVTDNQLLPIIEETLDRNHPREWFWALMDYGTYLKQSGLGYLDKNRHYKKQPPLKGSIREIRGMILSILTKTDVSEATLKTLVPLDERFSNALKGLRSDGLVSETAGRLHLTR